MKQAPVLNEREKQRMLQHLQRTSYAARIDYRIIENDDLVIGKVPLL